MTDPTTPRLWIDRESTVPMFEQICTRLRAQIASAALPKGAKLPPTRALATELGVSRSTIVTAYEQLVAEGYLHGLRGSGYVVLDIGKVELPAAPKKAAEALPTSVPLVPPEPRVRPFKGGQPDMRLFPHRKWGQALSRVCRKYPHTLLGATEPFGNAALRLAVARHVRDWRGIETDPAQIIITAGASDALDLCFDTLAQKGDRIGLEDPGYIHIRTLAKKRGLVPVNLHIDAGGARLPPAGKPMRLAVVTPSHQYPLGGAMPPERRQMFLHWAQENNGWVIEDDYDSEFRYAGQPITAMAGIDRRDRTIYVGSFSKIFSNTLRLGYIVAPAALVAAFQARLHESPARASTVAQQALAEFILAGEFYRHLRRMRRIYDERRRFLLACLKEDFPCYGTFIDHQAGMQVVLHLHPQWSDQRIAQIATTRGITASALSGFCAGPSDLNGLVIGYCGFTTSEIQRGLTILEDVLKGCSNGRLHHR